MVNSREELIKKIEERPNVKHQKLILKLAKHGLFDSIIGKSDEELANMLIRIAKNGGNE